MGPADRDSDARYRSRAARYHSRANRGTKSARPRIQQAGINRGGRPGWASIARGRVSLARVSSAVYRPGPESSATFRRWRVGTRLLQLTWCWHEAYRPF